MPGPGLSDYLRGLGIGRRFQPGPAPMQSPAGAEMIPQLQGLPRGAGPGTLNNIGVPQYRPDGPRIQLPEDSLRAHDARLKYRQEISDYNKAQGIDYGIGDINLPLEGLKDPRLEPLRNQPDMTGRLTTLPVGAGPGTDNSIRSGNPFNLTSPPPKGLNHLYPDSEGDAYRWLRERRLGNPEDINLSRKKKR